MQPTSREFVVQRGRLSLVMFRVPTSAYSEAFRIVVTKIDILAVHHATVLETQAASMDHPSKSRMAQRVVGTRA